MFNSLLSPNCVFCFILHIQLKVFTEVRALTIVGVSCFSVLSMASSFHIPKKKHSGGSDSAPLTHLSPLSRLQSPAHQLKVPSLMQPSVQDVIVGFLFMGCSCCWWMWRSRYSHGFYLIIMWILSEQGYVNRGGRGGTDGTCPGDALGAATAADTKRFVMPAELEFYDVSGWSSIRQ